MVISSVEKPASMKGAISSKDLKEGREREREMPESSDNSRAKNLKACI